MSAAEKMREEAARIARNKADDQSDAYQEACFDIAVAIERILTEPDTTARETLAAWMIAQGYATGWTETIEDLLEELKQQLDVFHSVHAELMAETDDLRAENESLRNAHAALVQDAHDKLAAQRVDIARKDEALNRVSGRQCGACRVYDNFGIKAALR